MTTAKATTTANTEGATSHMLISERHHGTLGPTATLTTSWVSMVLDPTVYWLHGIRVTESLVSRHWAIWGWGY